MAAPMSVWSRRRSMRCRSNSPVISPSAPRSGCRIAPPRYYPGSWYEPTWMAVFIRTGLEYDPMILRPVLTAIGVMEVVSPEALVAAAEGIASDDLVV